MAHTGVFATEEECKTKAGEGISSTIASEAYINQLCKEIEAFVNNLTREDFSTNWALYKTTATGLLTEIESNYCGYFLALGDPAGYGSQRENENTVNTCWARFVQCIGLLKDQKTVSWIKEQTT